MTKICTYTNILLIYYSGSINTSMLHNLAIPLLDFNCNDKTLNFRIQ